MNGHVPGARPGSPASAKPPASPLAVLAPLRRSKSLAELSYDRIQRMLMAGRFQPGQKLPVRQLAAAFDVSPTPVRDALLKMTNEGGLEGGRRQHFRVPAFGPAEAMELVKLRLALEGLAVETICGQLSPAILEQCRGCHAIAAVAAAQANSAGFRDAIVDARLRLYGSSELPMLTSIIRVLWSIFTPEIAKIENNEMYFTKKLRADYLLLESLQKKDTESALEALEYSIYLDASSVISQKYILDKPA